MLTVIFHLAIVLAGTCLVLTGKKFFEGKDSEGVIYFVLTVVFIILFAFAFLANYHGARAASYTHQSLGAAKLEEQIRLFNEEQEASMWSSY